MFAKFNRHLFGYIVPCFYTMSFMKSFKKRLILRGLAFLSILSVIYQLDFIISSIAQKQSSSLKVTMNLEPIVSFENRSVTKIPTMIEFNQILLKLKKRNIDAWSIVRSSWNETKQTVASSSTLKYMTHNSHFTSKIFSLKGIPWTFIMDLHPVCQG